MPTPRVAGPVQQLVAVLRRAMPLAMSSTSAVSISRLSAPEPLRSPQQRPPHHSRVQAAGKLRPPVCRLGGATRGVWGPGILDGLIAGEHTHAPWRLLAAHHVFQQSGLPDGHWRARRRCLPRGQQACRPPGWPGRVHGWKCATRSVRAPNRAFFAIGGMPIRESPWQWCRACSQRCGPAPAVAGRSIGKPIIRAKGAAQVARRPEYS